MTDAAVAVPATAAALTLDVRLSRADVALEIALALPAHGITAICGASGAGKPRCCA